MTVALQQATQLLRFLQRLMASRRTEQPLRDMGFHGTPRHTGSAARSVRWHANI